MREKLYTWRIKDSPVHVESKIPPCNMALETNRRIEVRQAIRSKGWMKGQLFSSDMMAAVFLFSIMASLILFAWNSSTDKAVEDLQRKDMEITATRILDILVKSQGYPADWENNNAAVIGLANFDRTIDAAKLSAFISMDYNKTRNIFGASYNYFFKLGNFTKGINGTETVFARRMVLFNNTAQFMELTLSR